MPAIHRYDLPEKWANETHIALAPAYTDVDTWEKVSLADAEAETAEEGETAEGETAEEE